MPVHGLPIAVFLISTTFSVVGADHRSGQHWATTVKPFSLGIIKSIVNNGDGGNDWLGNWDWALEAWSQLPGLNLVTVPGETDSETRMECPAKEGYVRVCNHDYGETSWRGMARWNYYVNDDDDEEHIYQCIVKLNDNRRTDHERKWMCHELGHCLGLGHTSTEGESDNSCMDYSTAPSSIGPGEIDYDVLEDVYDHLDSFDSYEFVNPPPQVISCSDSDRADLIQKCDCSGPAPNKAWANEMEYELCIASAIQGTGCGLNSVLELGGCLPFDPPTPAPTIKTKVPTMSPTKLPTNKSPTKLPTNKSPTKLPTKKSPPTRSPTVLMESDTPSETPSAHPSIPPVVLDSDSPSQVPSLGASTNSPTIEDNSDLDFTLCYEKKLFQIAQLCDCHGPVPNSPIAWANEDEYLQCVDTAVRHTGCELQKVLDIADCLPLHNTAPSSMPTFEFRAGPNPTEDNEEEDDDSLSTVDSVCTQEELAELSTVCSCSKKWKNAREYERCVEKAIENSPCQMAAVIQVSACYLSFPPKDKHSSSGNNVQCESYLTSNECKRRNESCQWRPLENICITQPARRLLHQDDEKDDDYYTPSLRIREKHWDRTYISSECHSPSRFGLPEKATLIMASKRSCKYEIRNGNRVEVVGVLL
eukprot:scaffold1934_cov79-Cylindrotheca_fusiformis.AAC.11